MLEPSYNLLFGKLPLRCLFHDYFEDAKHFSTKLLLKPTDDPHVDLIATVSFKPLPAFFYTSFVTLSYMLHTRFYLFLNFTV